MTMYFAVLLVVIVVGYGIAYTRKGKVSSAAMGSRKHELHTAATPDQAFEAISRIGRPYSVDDRDASSKIIVLSSPVTFFSWGFLYPVFLHAEPGGGTKVQIGCHSKFFQVGPIVTRAHGNVLQAIEAAVSIPAARVA
jgi:hypothetical protein